MSGDDHLSGTCGLVTSPTLIPNFNSPAPLVAELPCMGLSINREKYFSKKMTKAKSRLNEVIITPVVGEWGWKFKLRYACGHRA